MDVVIPVAREAANHTLHLAIGSIRLYAPELRVVLTGEVGMGMVPPYGDVAEYAIPFAQPAGQPIANTDRAMWLACMDAQVSDPFLWSNDDIYWRRPVTWEEYEHHSGVARGPLQMHNPANPSVGMYSRLNTITHQLLSTAKLPLWDYERHVPLLVHKARMLEALEMGGSKRSVYGNLSQIYPTALRKDVKLFLSEEALPEVAFEPWFSTGNNYPVSLLPDILGIGSVAAEAGSQASMQVN